MVIGCKISDEYANKMIDRNKVTVVVKQNTAVQKVPAVENEG